MKNFSIIVAMDKNKGIGKAGDLPWHLPSDMKFFKETTLTADDGKQNAVIMGRTTWDSIPEKFRPLPGRLNIILTRNADINFPAGCCKASSFDEALALIDERSDIDNIFIIGGANVYAQAIQRSECEKLYMTQVQSVCDCDVFFPDIPEYFQIASQGKVNCENEYDFIFFQYVRP